MRTLLTLLLCLAFLAPKAQFQKYTSAAWGYTPFPTFLPYSLIANENPSHTWRLQSFSSVSLGYIFLGGGITYVSAPLGLMVSRPLNNNFTAFGAATVAPTAFHFNSMLAGPYGPLAGPYGPAYRGNNYSGFGVNAAVTGGVMYTNDAHTFSISGSISVERGSYPVYSAPRPAARKQY